MMECAMYNIQQVGRKVDDMQFNMADIVNQLSQIQSKMTTDDIQSLKREVKEIQQQMATDKEEMQQEIVSQKEEIQNLNLKLESHLSEENFKPEKEELSGYVSFTAYATAKRNYNRGGATLRNYGSAYFVNVSEFICPVNAYYMISMSLLADSRKMMYGRIMLDDEQLAIACARNDAPGAATHPSSSQTVVTYCEARQRIWVQCVDHNNNRIYGEPTVPYSTFGLTLLRVV